jgi:hypothetical protein
MMSGSLKNCIGKSMRIIYLQGNQIRTFAVRDVPHIHNYTNRTKV